MNTVHQVKPSADTGGRLQIHPVGIGLALSGAAAAAISIFLPVAQNPGFPLGIHDNTLIQNSGAGQGIAVRYVICAVVIVVLTWRYWSEKQASWGILIPAAVLGVGAVVDMNNGEMFELVSVDPGTGDPLDALDDGTLFDTGTVKADPAIAMYMAMAGGILAFVGGLLMWRASTPASAAPVAAVPVTAKPAPSAAITKTDSEIAAEQLKRLGELRAQGVVSDDEFAAKKKDLLDRL